MTTQPFGHIGVIGMREPFGVAIVHRELCAEGIQMNKMNSRSRVETLAMPTGLLLKSYLATAAVALALLAVPHSGHAQGIVGGAREGAREGNRAAGPVGAVVGGAVGAGVGGAMGAVDGVLGLPRHRWRHGCRGFYDRYDRFHCYR
jgi:hypothetical protein